MRPTLALSSDSFEHAGFRILRLLAIYRVVAAFGAIALAFGEGARYGGHTAALGFLTFYAVLHCAAFALTGAIWLRQKSLLTLFIVVDTIFFLLVASFGNSVLFVAGLLPILVTHGWILRNQLASVHAALLAVSGILYTVLNRAPLAEGAFIAIGAFAAASLGAFLGRVGSDAMDLADRRGEDLEKLSALNQRIIDEIDQGILVVDREGNLLQANPQAGRWLFADSPAPPLPRPLMQISQPLGVSWANWKEGNTMVDTGVTLGAGESQVKVRPRFLSTELRRAGDTVVFLEDLRIAQARAQQLKLAALGRLTANIAHEIRNPLSAVRQAGQLLAEKNDTAEPGDRRLTEMIEKNVRRIDRIVTNVLSLTKRDKVAPKVLEVTQTLTELAREWAEQAQLPASMLTLTIEPNLKMRADLGQLEEIVWNLLSNAWRHSTQQPGSVTMGVRRSPSGRAIAIDVTDDGAGVPSDHRESIFEPFFSLSGSSGLGLYISRELAQSNGGSLELTEYGPGAQFRVLVPAISDDELDNA